MSLPVRLRVSHDTADANLAREVSAVRLFASALDCRQPHGGPAGLVRGTFGAARKHPGIALGLTTHIGFVAASTVCDSLASSGINPASLKLELTESVELDNVDVVVSRMQQLNALGVSFCLAYQGFLFCKPIPIEEWAPLLK